MIRWIVDVERAFVLWASIGMRFSLAYRYCRFIGQFE